VVTNLVANALKYSPQESPVRVEARGLDGWVSLAVHNRGAPIPPDKFPHLFLPMQRATNEVDRAGRSVGLGLYIVDHIVRAHGGRVEVRSTQAEGTTFTVWLPRSAPVPRS
jgi:signal transduction histidine kinase